MKKPCPICMSLRARFVRWLGITLGVMVPIKEKREVRMEWTQDQIAAVIGSKELEIISLRMQLARAQSRLKELEPESEQKPTLKEVK